MYLPTSDLGTVLYVSVHTSNFLYGLRSHGEEGTYTSRFRRSADRSSSHAVGCVPTYLCRYIHRYLPPAILRGTGHSLEVALAIQAQAIGVAYSLGSVDVLSVLAEERT